VSSQSKEAFQNHLSRFSLIKFYLLLGKARRLKQAKEEAQSEIEAYRLEREKQFKEFESKVKLNFRHEFICNTTLFYCHHSIWDLEMTLQQRLIKI
jgi:hypothetical protein